MRIVTEQDLAYTRRVLYFSEAERKTLRRAAAIADEARRRCTAEVGDIEWEGDDFDTFLAHVGISVDEVVEGFEVDARPGGLLG